MLYVPPCSYLQYLEHRRIFDPFLSSLGTPVDPFQGQPNPWLSDTVDFWQVGSDIIHRNIMEQHLESGRNNIPTENNSGTVEMGKETQTSKNIKMYAFWNINPR